MVDRRTGSADIFIFSASKTASAVSRWVDGAFRAELRVSEVLALGTFPAGHLVKHCYEIRWTPF